MASLTVRDIPDDIMETLRVLARKERRSLNKELLTVLEEGLQSHLALLKTSREESSISKDTQLALWTDLCGKWQDTRTSDEIIEEIVSARTMGREVEL